MIILNDNNLQVISFNKILSVTAEEIVVKFKKETIYIEGSNLSLSSYEKEQFEVIGTIRNIKIHED